MKEARDKRVIHDKAQMSTYYMEKYKEAIDRGIQFIELENPIEEPESGNVLQGNVGELLKNQAVAEAQASAASASEEAIKAKKADKEKTMDSFPDAVMNYIQLQSDSKLKQEVYLNLVKQCEQDRVQEAMESMDIQIIDHANLPDINSPSAPRKKLISIIGFFTGIILSVVYTFTFYKREKND